MHAFRRVYGAAFGSWLQEDPIGFQAGDANPRRYVGNNATNATDPSGLANYFLDFAKKELIDLRTGKAIKVPSGAWPKVARLAGIGGVIFGATLRGAFLSARLQEQLDPSYGGQSNLQFMIEHGIIGNRVRRSKSGRPGDYSLGEMTGITAPGQRTELRRPSSPFQLSPTELARLKRLQHLQELIRRTSKNRGGACFAAGTPLLTPDGSRPIEQFRPGDWVLARPEYEPEGALTARQVEEVFVRTGRVLKLHAGGRIIETMAEHPFWAQDKGWVPAGELLPGDLLSSHDGQWVAVEAVLDTGDYATVYNLRVAEDHTYFVGCDEWGFSVWAHNACLVLVQITAADAAGMGYAQAAWNYRMRNRAVNRGLTPANRAYWAAGGHNIGYVTTTTRQYGPYSSGALHTEPTMIAALAVSFDLATWLANVKAFRVKCFQIQSLRRDCSGDH
jgi:large repetitive protein